jgi:hypothetical protein
MMRSTITIDFAPVSLDEFADLARDLGSRPRILVFGKPAL